MDGPRTALIFAAGKGERMRPLTLHTPKPLLEVGGKPLMVWHLEKLPALGVRDVVVNIAWLAECFEPVLGDGSRWGLRLHFSREGPEPLETGGGILHALPMLGDAPFWLLNGDVFCDVDLHALRLRDGDLAQLLMVDVPQQAERGDFHLDHAGRLHAEGEPRLTYAGIGLLHPQLLQDWREVIGDAAGADAQPPRFKLAPLLRAAMRQERVGGVHHRGAWTDVGTPQRLAALDAQIRAASANLNP